MQPLNWARIVSPRGEAKLTQLWLVDSLRGSSDTTSKAYGLTVACARGWRQFGVLLELLRFAAALAARSLRSVLWRGRRLGEISWPRPAPCPISPAPFADNEYTQATTMTVVATGRMKAQVGRMSSKGSQFRHTSRSGAIHAPVLPGLSGRCRPTTNCVLTWLRLARQPDHAGSLVGCEGTCIDRVSLFLRRRIDRRVGPFGAEPGPVWGHDSGHLSPFGS